MPVKKSKKKTSKSAATADAAADNQQKHHHHHHHSSHKESAEKNVSEVIGKTSKHGAASRKGAKKANSGGGGGGGGSGGGGGGHNRALPLHTAQQLPVIGLGTWQAPKGQVGEAVRYAIEELGYRHLDCASNYLNEDEIGDTLTELFKRGVVKREDLFITGKLNNPYHHREHVRPHVEKSLKDLNTPYLDLLLMHWPVAFHHVPYDGSRRGYDDSYDPDGLSQLDLSQYNGSKVDTSVSIQETWQAMEELVAAGLVKSIGVANFNTGLLHDLLTYAKVRPTVVQNELHPYCQQSAFVDYCKRQNIVVEAYSPLGSPGSNCGTVAPAVIEDCTLKQIAKAHKVSVARVCLQWGVQRGTVVLPKSTNHGRLRENLQSGLIDSKHAFTLSDVEMQKIQALDKNIHYLDPYNWYGIPLFGENGKRAKKGVRMVLIGPPGSGKATQAPYLADYFGVPYLSTSQLLRQKRPDLGSVMDLGELVSDDAVVDLVSDALDSVEAVNGFILDGFPKNVEQAQRFSELLSSRGEALDAVIEFQVENNSVLVHRVMGRWVHEASGRVYHTEFAPPLANGIDDETGEPLVRHADDSEQALLKRLDTYFLRTEPLLAYYRKLKIAACVDAGKHPLFVFKEIKDKTQALSLDKVIDEFEHVDGSDAGGAGAAKGGSGVATEGGAANSQSFEERASALNEREALLGEREAALVKREKELEELERSVREEELRVASAEVATRGDKGGNGGKARKGGAGNGAKKKKRSAK